ncbi:AI-2E family transporter [Afifella sp. IM 167]|uniref:AI-2E family transporter n=1 Tax=Afifella sp. IM 167 TaxID=2033586 RepID=UPI001CC93FAB|nr:AI-2E family transporter [Afifella sp. IM 167]MBZ8133503.1 hypothetical protein [Afifella sp. IM 167]
MEKVEVRGPAIFLGIAALLFLIWMASKALLLVFAGIVLAAAFSFLAAPIERLTGLSGKHVKPVIYLAFLAAIGVVVGWGGSALVVQASEFASHTDELLRSWNAELSDLGLGFMSQAGDMQLSKVMPDLQSVFGDFRRMLSGFFGGLANFVIVLFLGIFLSWDPRTYLRGLLHLVPSQRRARLREVVESAAENLGWWMAGQAISMSIIFAASWLVLWLIGMPYNFLLALQAGLLAFIPTLGPAIAGVVIILAGFSVSPTMALWGLGAYVLIQALESNVTQPVVQQKTTSLPPALTLSTQLVFAAVLGGLGVALAVPLLSVIIVFVRELYVKDALGDDGVEV